MKLRSLHEKGKWRLCECFTVCVEVETTEWRGSVEAIVEFTSEAELGSSECVISGGCLSVLPCTLKLISLNGEG